MFPTRMKHNPSGTKRLLTEFRSPDDNGQKRAKVYWGTNRVKVDTHEDSDRAVIVNELEPCFNVEFFYKNRKEGTLVYPEKSLDYVENAAENWVLGVFDVEWLRYHIQQQEKERGII